VVELSALALLLTLLPSNWLPLSVTLFLVYTPVMCIPLLFVCVNDVDGGDVDDVDCVLCYGGVVVVTGIVYVGYFHCGNAVVLSPCLDVFGSVVIVGGVDVFVVYGAVTYAVVGNSCVVGWAVVGVVVYVGVCSIRDVVVLLCGVVYNGVVVVVYVACVGGVWCV